MFTLISGKNILTILGITLSVCALTACVRGPMTEDNAVEEGSGFGAGASSQEESLTDVVEDSESSQVVENSNEEIREVPLGTPVSPGDFQDLKQSAEQLSGDDESTSDVDNEEIREVPLGTPVSPGDFQDLKQSAEQLSGDDESTSDADM